MDAKRLITDYETKAWQFVKNGEMSRKAKEETSDELTNIIRQQQVEIDRLNRAYEVLQASLRRNDFPLYDGHMTDAGRALIDAQRIKDAEQG